MAPKRKKGGHSTLGIGNLLEVLSQGRDSRADASAPVRTCVLVDLDAPRYLALAVRDALVPKTPTATVDVWPLGVRLDSLGEVPDACVVIPGHAAADCADAVRHMVGLGVPCAIVVPSALDAPEVELGPEASALLGVVAASDEAALPRKLASWLVRAAGEKDVALAAAFPFCRQAVVDGLALRCALENAAMGAISLVPGSDFPLMTTNQAKLAVQMASCYGQGALTPRRAAEICGVVGAGAAYRSLARSAAGLLPGIGNVLKAGIAFAGTMATARGVRASLEGFSPLDALSDEKAPAARKAPVAVPVGPLPAPSPEQDVRPIEYLEIDPDGKARP